LLFKERWDPTPMFTGETLKQRIIVIFSFKYQEKIDQEARVDGFYARLIYKYLKRMKRQPGEAGWAGETRQYTTKSEIIQKKRFYG